MANKKIKIYTHITFTTFFVAIIVPIIVIGLIVLSILLPEFLILTIPVMLCLTGAYIGMIVCGELTPKYLSDKGIEYRRKSIDWTDVKITAIPFYSSPYQFLNSRFPCGYYLIFDDKYLLGEDAKKQYKKRFCVYVTKKPLELILQHCQSRILVLDITLKKEVLPHSTKKINEIINNFNKQFDK